jgi:hypothetical protein
VTSDRRSGAASSGAEPASRGRHELGCGLTLPAFQQVTGGKNANKHPNERRYRFGGASDDRGRGSPASWLKLFIGCDREGGECPGLLAASLPDGGAYHGFEDFVLAETCCADGRDVLVGDSVSAFHRGFSPRYGTDAASSWLDV